MVATLLATAHPAPVTMPRWTGTTTQRGLGAAHQADKKRLLAALRPGDPCWRCGQPMYLWQQLDRDHVTDRVLGGGGGPAVLAHASCNRSAGAKLLAQLRRAGQQPRRIRTDTRKPCRICGKPYDRAARPCEICGAHYHPNNSTVRTCGRECGVKLKQRNTKLRLEEFQPAMPSKPPPVPAWTQDALFDDAECRQPVTASREW